jgi:uncharacterized sulfatase
LLDLYPTLADLAGLTPPKDLQGASLRPLLDDPDAKWTRPAYTQVERTAAKITGHSVRTDRWRYTVWNRGQEGVELYDHDADPKELKNLAADPKYAETVAELKQLVEKMHPTPVAGGKADPDTKAKWVE